MDSMSDATVECDVLEAGEQPPEVDLLAGCIPAITEEVGALRFTREDASNVAHEPEEVQKQALDLARKTSCTLTSAWVKIHSHNKALPGCNVRSTLWFVDVRVPIIADTPQQAILGAQVRNSIDDDHQARAFGIGRSDDSMEFFRPCDRCREPLKEGDKQVELRDGRVRCLVCPDGASA